MSNPLSAWWVITALLLHYGGKSVSHSAENAMERLHNVPHSLIRANSEARVSGVVTNIEPVKITRLPGQEKPDVGLLLSMAGIRDCPGASGAEVSVGEPSWSSERVQALITIVLIAMATGWALLLRRQVAAQTATLRHHEEQLEAARSTAENALQRVRLAENLEQGKEKIVEFIARDEPIELVLLEMAKAIESHTAGQCSIQIESADGERVHATPSMSHAWRDALQQLPIGAARTGARHRSLDEFSSDSRWSDFIKTQMAIPGTVFAAPVHSAGERVGFISVFHPERGSVSDTEAVLIGSWGGLASMAYERRSLYDQLSYRARHDELTGLPNRLLLFERLNTEIRNAPLRGCGLGVMYIDLDCFKLINDTFGHGAGDLALQRVAERMTDAIRCGDTVARVGGDEFVVVLPELSLREDAEAIAEKLAIAVDQPIDIEETMVVLGASIGISVFPADGEDAGSLLRAADADMYRRKVKARQRRAEVAQLLGA